MQSVAVHECAVHQAQLKASYVTKMKPLSSWNCRPHSEHHRHYNLNSLGLYGYTTATWQTCIPVIMLLWTKLQVVSLIDTECVDCSRHQQHGAPCCMWRLRCTCCIYVYYGRLQRLLLQASTACHNMTRTEHMVPVPCMYQTSQVPFLWRWTGFFVCWVPVGPQDIEHIKNFESYPGCLLRLVAGAAAQQLKGADEQGWALERTSTLYLHTVHR